MTAIALPAQTGRVRTADSISQMTAVEQARAVAEVQAAIIVAQNNPRDMDRARNEMRDACGRMALASEAFYRVPNRGSGPSVHLARELARIWGNIDHGVRELRRDDEAGESEVQAYSWDQQSNVRSTRSFIVPHARMKGGKREKLNELNDIYLNNQNTGARAVRECIYSVLPKDFVREAEGICQRTLEHGEGKPLEQRIAEMVAAFKTIDVSAEQIEAKLDRKRGQWTAADVAHMGVIFTSVQRGEITAADEFPQQRVTAELIARQRSEKSDKPKASKKAEPVPALDPKEPDEQAIAELNAEAIEQAAEATAGPESTGLFE